MNKSATQEVEQDQTLGQESESTDSLYAMALGAMNRAADAVGLQPHVRAILSEPKNSIIVNFPVKMDDGEYRMFRGYRIQHNNVLGPYKGGIRYHEHVSLDDVRALSLWMTLKCSLAGLPYGGAKGGVTFNPRERSQDEIRRITRRFTTSLGTNIGPDHDIPAPDVGTNAQTMVWIMDTYMNTTTGAGRGLPLGVVTGKTLEVGGSLGRDKATGQGVVDVCVQLLPEVGIDIAGCRFALQGYGNVGSHTAMLLQDLGATLSGVMDHTGAIVGDGAIDAHGLAEHVTKTGGVAGYEFARSVDLDEFYDIETDVFIPAALERMITVPIAKKLKTRAVVEAANGPTEVDAEPVLRSRGIEVFPAILCNAGGVTVSYFEWIQNRNNERWTLAQVDERLGRYVEEMCVRVRVARREFECDVSTAAHIVALQRIASVYDQRGIFP